jgi:hypothetical protein
MAIFRKREGLFRANDRLNGGLSLTSEYHSDFQTAQEYYPDAPQ